MVYPTFIRTTEWTIKKLNINNNDNNYNYNNNNKLMHTYTIINNTN